MRLLRGILPFLLALSVHAQAIDPKAVDRLMLETMKAWQIPGAAVAIVRDDKVVYVQGYGTKEAGGTARVTPDTVFQIASTSKAFTSTALAMLASEKKLAFDDRVRKHLDYFQLSDPCADANVTLRDIVSHRTGLSRHDALWDNTPITREDVVRRIGQVALTKPFRSAYQYQNITFIAAGEVVARVSGMSWDDFVRTRIFRPLGMQNTVTSEADWNTSDHAYGYRYDWKTNRVSPQPPIDTTTIGAGGAIKSSARDMANWIRFQLADGMYDGRQLVDPALLAETRTPQTVIVMQGLTREANPETNLMAYAMGWNVQDYRGELLVAHAGALNGFRTHVDLLPKHKAGFVITINVGRGLALIALRNALADMLLGKPSPRDWSAYYLTVDRNADEKSARDREERMAKRHKDTAPTLPLASYAGDYDSPAYGKATVSAVDGALVLRWNRLAIPLQHFHYDVFTAESEADDVDEEIVFGLGSDRAVKTLTLFGETFTAAPKPPPS